MKTAPHPMSRIGGVASSRGEAGAMTLMAGKECVIRLIHYFSMDDNGYEYVPLTRSLGPKPRINVSNRIRELS